MDLEQTYNYFFNLINSSVTSDKFKADINQNLFNLLVPFYANLLNNPNNGLNQNLNNHAIEKELNSLAMKLNSVNESATKSDYLNHHNHRSLQTSAFKRQIDENHSNYNLNNSQTLKAQNLHKILNRIQSIKAINEASNYKYQDNHPSYDNRMCSTSPPMPPIESHSSLDSGQPFDELLKAVVNKKTVRELLEERQNYIKKLEDNQLELSKINQEMRQQQARNISYDNTLPDLVDIPNIEKLSVEIIPIQVQPESRQIEHTYKHGYPTNMPSQTKIIPPRIITPPIRQHNFNILNIQEPKIHDNFRRHEEVIPKKGLTVRQLLERHRKRQLNRPDYNGHFESNKRLKLSRKSRIQNTNDFLQHYRLVKTPKASMVDTCNIVGVVRDEVGRSDKNPIVLSDEDSVHSLDSSVCTEQSFASDSGSLNEYYDLYSEHNYVFNPSVITQAKQAIINLNRLQMAVKDNDSNGSKIDQEIAANFTTEQMKSLTNSVEQNHSNIDGIEYARHLNLIKSRDLKRKPYAYLSSKFPINAISRSIYAGVDTKKAVLDFPKHVIDPNLLETKFTNKSVKRLNVTQMKDCRNGQKFSNNWLSYLENFDFSSPLSRKIIRIFPEFHSKKNAKNGKQDNKTIT